MENNNELMDLIQSMQEEQRGIKARSARWARNRHRLPSARRTGARRIHAGPRARRRTGHDRDEGMPRLISTKDTGNTATWIADDLKLIEDRRKVSQLLTHDTLPATGMSMEYHVVTSDTTASANRRRKLRASFGKVAFGTKTADINTYGGYTSLSRQTIERSTTPMLNTAITALQNAYAKATEKAVRDHLYAEIKAQRDASSNANKIDAPQLANMTIDDWVSLIIDASELADDRNVSLTRLAVSKDVLKALVKLKDTGDRFFNLSGDGSDTIGSFDLTGVAGTFMRVPVVLLPNADAGLASFIDPAAVTVWESGGPAQLTDGNVTGLTNSYSVYGYMAVATTHADGLIPVKFAAA